MNEPQKWLPAVALIIILWLTIVGLAVGPVTNDNVGIDVDSGTSALIIGILAVVAFINLLTVRFLVLPRAVTNPDAREEQIAVMGYSFATAPAIYGVVVSIVTGQGLLALPFGAIALYALFVVWCYLRESFGSPRKG